MAAAGHVRVGTIPLSVRRLETRGAAAGLDLARRRKLVADLCRMLDPQPAPSPVSPSGPAAAGLPGAASEPIGRGKNIEPDLSPRMRQTLDRLLAGDSEKEIAAHFRRSRHTVHVYVKKLYQRYGVSSRGELFARFIRPPAAAAETSAPAQ